MFKFELDDAKVFFDAAADGSATATWRVTGRAEVASAADLAGQLASIFELVGDAASFTVDRSGENFSLTLSVDVPAPTCAGLPGLTEGLRHCEARRDASRLVSRFVAQAADARRIESAVRKSYRAHRREEANIQ